MSEKKPVDLFELLARPIETIDTRVGAVYVYSPTPNALKRYRALSSLGSDERARHVLPLIASQELRTKHSMEIVPLPAKALDALEAVEIGRIAEAVRLKRLVASAPGADKLPEISPQQDGEAPFEFFDRVMKSIVEQDAAADRAILEKARRLAESPIEKLLDPLGASTARLSDTLLAFERAAKPEIPEFKDFAGDMALRVERERQADRKTALLTAEMTKQSAEMLRDLSLVAQDFVARLDYRDKQADQQFRLQVWIAVGSLFASVALSAVGAWFAGASFFQDRQKNQSDEAAAIAAKKDAAIQEQREERLLAERVKALEAFQRATNALEAVRTSSQPASDATKPK